MSDIESDYFKDSLETISNTLSEELNFRYLDDKQLSKLYDCLKVEVLEIEIEQIRRRRNR